VLARHRLLGAAVAVVALALGQAAFAQPRGHLDPAERARLRHELREQSRAERAWQAPEWRARGLAPAAPGWGAPPPGPPPGARGLPPGAYGGNTAPPPNWAPHPAAPGAPMPPQGGAAGPPPQWAPHPPAYARPSGPPPDSPRLTPEERQQLRIMLRERRAAARGEGPTPPPGPER